MSQLTIKISGWDGIQPDSYFSGLLIKVLDGFESVIVGRYYR